MPRHPFLLVAQLAFLLTLSGCHKANAPAQAPAITPKWTFTATGTGKIAAFPMQHGPLMNSPWPKFQHDPANTARPPQF